MNCRDSGRAGDLALCDWKIETVSLCEPDRLQLQEHFTE
jgi:hypothetical protein